MKRAHNLRSESVILNIRAPSLIQSLSDSSMPKQESGKSHQTRPISKRPPSWCKYQPEEVEALVIKLAKEGNSTSRIGTILRDQYAIPLVKPMTGKTITKILKEAQLAPKIPEDLASLMKKAESLSAHYQKNRSDLHNKRALQLIEAKIHKLSRYYKREGVLPKNWKYEAKIASLA
jgi:small subunit ribosomal protein S15